MTHEAGIEAACVSLSNLCYASLEVQAAAAIQAYLSASGMVLVPREPTEEMLQALHKEEPNFSPLVFSEIFSAVVAAAPDPFKSKP